MTFVEQVSFFDNKQEATSKQTDKRSCEKCKYYSALGTPRERSDGSVIYGYCFKNGDKDYNPNMGKGFAVFIQDGSCKSFKKRGEK